MTFTQLLGDDFDACVAGATGGLGAAFVRLLQDQPGCQMIHCLSRTGVVRKASEHVVGTKLDLTDSESISDAVAAITSKRAPRLIIIATGVLHDGANYQPERSWRELDAAHMARSFAVNATGPTLLAAHLLQRISRQDPAIIGFLSARVGSISDNRRGGWYSYRASKAALNQSIKTLAIEARRSRPNTVIVGLQPGTVRTPLSAPFRSAVAEEDLLEPETSARALLDVLTKLSIEQSGKLFDHRGIEFAP